MLETEVWFYYPPSLFVYTSFSTATLVTGTAQSMNKLNPKDSLKARKTTTSLQDLANYLAKRQIGKVG